MTTKKFQRAYTAAKRTQSTLGYHTTALILNQHLLYFVISSHTPKRTPFRDPSIASSSHLLPANNPPHPTLSAAKPIQTTSPTRSSPTHLPSPISHLPSPTPIFHSPLPPKKTHRLHPFPLPPSPFPPPPQFTPPPPRPAPIPPSNLLKTPTPTPSLYPEK